MSTHGTHPSAPAVGDVPGGRQTATSTPATRLFFIAIPSPSMRVDPRDVGLGRLVDHGASRTSAGATSAWRLSETGVAASSHIAPLAGSMRPASRPQQHRPAAVLLRRRGDWQVTGQAPKQRISSRAKEGREANTAAAPWRAGRVHPRYREHRRQGSGRGHGRSGRANPSPRRRRGLVPLSRPHVGRPRTRRSISRWILVRSPANPLVRGGASCTGSDASTAYVKVDAVLDVPGHQVGCSRLMGGRSPALQRAPAHSRDAVASCGRSGPCGRQAAGPQGPVGDPQRVRRRDPRRRRMSRRDVHQTPACSATTSTAWRTRWTILCHKRATSGPGRSHHDVGGGRRGMADLRKRLVGRVGLEPTTDGL